MSDLNKEADVSEEPHPFSPACQSCLVESVVAVIDRVQQVDETLKERRIFSRLNRNPVKELELSSIGNVFTQ